MKLTKPLASKSQTEIKIEWEYPLAKESGREGQIDPETFMLPILSREFRFMMITTVGICCSITADRSFIMILMIILFDFCTEEFCGLVNGRFPES
jgi:hypothetical protein